MNIRSYLLIVTQYTNQWVYENVFSNITLFLFQAVSGTTCTTAGTECDAIANSHCDASKCKCNDGFVMNVDICAAENAGKFLCNECKCVYHRKCR
jgi:hypothetical protein